MGRPRKLNKKVSTSLALSPLTIKELDDFVGEESRSQLADIAIINEIKRRKEVNLWKQNKY